jgi:hypothetical protein
MRTYCKVLTLYATRNRNSVVSIATGYGLDDGGVGVRVPVGSRIFSSPSSRPALGSTQLPTELVPASYFPGNKAEDDHSPPESGEVKKMWTSPIRLHGILLN